MAQAEEWMDDVSSLGASARTSYVQQVTKEELREKGWTKPPLNPKEDLLAYDAILDRHCMITKNKKFIDRWKGILRGQYLDLNKRRLMVEKQRAERWPAPSSPRPGHSRAPILLKPVRVKGSRKRPLDAGSQRPTDNDDDLIDLVGVKHSLSKLSTSSRSTMSTYTELSPYLTPNGIFLLPQYQSYKPFRVMEGTLMLLVPGLPEPLAIVTHPAGDTLSDLRREVTKSIKQVFSSSFTFLYANMQPILPSEEPSIYLKDLAGCILVRFRIHNTVISPVYEGGLDGIYDEDEIENNSTVKKTPSHTNATSDSRRSSLLPEIKLRPENEMQELEDAIRRLVIQLAIQAAVLIQKHWRAWIARRRIKILRQARNVKWAMNAAATRIQSIMRRFLAVRIFQHKKQMIMSPSTNADAERRAGARLSRRSTLRFGQPISPSRTDMPFHALVAIVKIQSLFRRRLALSIATKARREREKDLAVDAAFGGRGVRDYVLMQQEDVDIGVSSMRVRKSKHYLMKERKKELQDSLTDARKRFEEVRRKLSNELRVSRLSLSNTKAGRQSVVLPYTAKDSIDDMGELMYQAEIPFEEGVIPVKVYRSEACILFKAFLSTQSYSHQLRFDKASSEQEIITYYYALSRPDGAKLCQVLCASITYSKQRMSLLMDLNAYGGKEYIFEVEQSSTADTSSSPEGMDKPTNVVSKRYLLLSCYAEEGQDMRWSIKLDVMCSSTGIQYEASLGQEQWSFLGFGEWETLCALERQYLIRRVCTSTRLVHTNGAHYLECTFGKEGDLDVPSIESAKASLQLYPIDIDFTLSVLPEKRLLLKQNHVQIQGDDYIVSFFLHPKHLEVRALNPKTECEYEAKLNVEDFIFWLCNPLEDTLQLCRKISARLAIMADLDGNLSLRLPITTLSPSLRFNHDTWGESCTYEVKVYKVGGKLLVVAVERVCEETYFVLIKRNRLSLWGLGDAHEAVTDPDKQDTLVATLKNVMAINSPPMRQAKRVYLNVAAVPESSVLGDGLPNTTTPEGPQESNGDEVSFTTDESLTYRYVGLLMDNAAIGCSISMVVKS